LEYNPEVALCRWGTRNISPAHLDPATILLIQACDRTKQRGLAAARRSKEADKFTALDVEIDVFQGGKATVLLRETSDPEKRRQCTAFKTRAVWNGCEIYHRMDLSWTCSDRGSLASAAKLLRGRSAAVQFFAADFES
jgi:hypothetical protein